MQDTAVRFDEAHAGEESDYKILQLKNRIDLFFEAPNHKREEHRHRVAKACG